jgi:hypothetical protein
MKPMPAYRRIGQRALALVALLEIIIRVKNNPARREPKINHYQTNHDVIGRRQTDTLLKPD